MNPTPGDAFGELLRAAWTARPSGTTYEIIERDDSTIMAQPAERYFATPADEPDLAAALDLASGRVLDIGAGAGRCAVPLQDRGTDVTALDVSPGALALCRERGVRSTVLGTVFDHAGASYDTFLLYGNNLGLLGGPDTAPGFLSALSTLAAPGARVVAEGMDPYRTDNPVHLAYHDLNRRRGRWPGQLRIRIRYQNLASDWFDYLFCSVAELRTLLTGTGWRLADVLPRAEDRYLAVMARDG